MPSWRGRMEVEFGTGPDGGEQVRLDGRDVTAEIRAEAAGQGASRVAAWPEVRAALLERQRAFARPRDWWPTGAIWAPWSSPRPTSRFS